MCQRLGQLRDAMGRYAACFDASLLSAEQAAGAVAEAAALEKMAATLEGLAAARVAAGGAWQGTGDRSAAHHLARTTGTSVSQAAEVIETARRPGEAARRGCRGPGRGPVGPAQALSASR